MTTPAASPFEAIRHETAEGAEYWSARELAPLLGYVQWRNFVTALDKARLACINSDEPPADHFADTSNMIATGKGAQRRIADVHLSRYACYLVIRTPVTGRKFQWGYNPISCGKGDCSTSYSTVERPMRTIVGRQKGEQRLHQARVSLRAIPTW